MLHLHLVDPWKVLVELMHWKKVPYRHEPLASGVFIWVTKVFMEFVKKNLCVINRWGQQFQVLMNLNLNIGYSAASDKIRECYLSIHSIQYLSTHSHNRWERKALGLQCASAWMRYHCTFSVTWPAPSWPVRTAVCLMPEQSHIISANTKWIFEYHFEFPENTPSPFG